MRCLLLLLAAFFCLAEAKMQNVTVKGTTICHKRRQAGVLVQLWEHDTFDPNDLLQEVRSDSEGNFEVTGGEDEVGAIEPFIRITHNCDAKDGCMRVADYEIPKAKIDSTYDMTYVPMNIAVTGETTKCN